MEPPSSTVPWWKNRRRWFYATIIAILIGAPLGSWIWYDHNFPLPQWKSKKDGPFANPVFLPGHALLVPYQERLLKWKFRNQTAKLQLAGSIWEDPLTGGIAEFRSDGIFVWIKVPTMKRHISKVHDDPTYAHLIDGIAYRFFPDRESFFWNESEKSMSRIDTNLEFRGKDWNGYVATDGHHLGLCVSFDPHSSIGNRELIMTFTRQLKP